MLQTGYLPQPCGNGRREEGAAPGTNPSPEHNYESSQDNHAGPKTYLIAQTKKPNSQAPSKRPRSNDRSVPPCGQSTSKIHNFHYRGSNKVL